MNISPIYGSKKHYINGVPFRKVELTNKQEHLIYDTSGLYTDETYKIDIDKGLPELRREWILKRGDVEEYKGREVKPEDNGLDKTFNKPVKQFNLMG